MAQDLVAAVKDAGVVGAGGAGFPTHVKIAADVNTVIANGVECDPLLHCDQWLMQSDARTVVQGMRLVMEATGAERGILALKKEYEAAASSLRRAIDHQSDISLLLMDSRYPAGDEFVLVYEATGRLVPEAGLPLHVGCLVQNVQTLYNIARAAEGHPVTHRLLTVAGAVASPTTMWVPVGTAIRDVLSWAGGAHPPSWAQRIEGGMGEETSPLEYAVVVGGPMMGRVAADLDEPVTKTTSGLLVLPRDNVVARYMTRTRTSWVRRGVSTCDQCRDCTDLCPRYLLGHELMPHEVMRAVNYGLDRPAGQITAAVLCCECRVCEAYACPLELSPMAYYIGIKEELQALGWVNEVHRRTDLKPHPTREYRLVPTHRLIARLGLSEWEHQACPLDKADQQPARVSLPLRQHVGIPAVPVVATGQPVEAGDLVAAVPEGKLGANVHASMSGQVVAVSDSQIEISA